MTIEEEEEKSVALCLRVAAEPDPGVLSRVLAQFQNLNVIPRSVQSEVATNGLHVRIELFGLSERRLSLIAAKIGELPAVLNAYWHRL